MTITRIKGERRTIRFKLDSRKFGVFVISNAMWTLYDKRKNIVETGECVIEDKEITANVEFEDSGIYMLEVTAQVRDDILKKREYIEVLC